VVKTLVDDVNLNALSPILRYICSMRLRWAQPPVARRPVELGGGLRVTLLNSVDLSVGHMVNVRLQPQESTGAFFVLMQFEGVSIRPAGCCRLMAYTTGSCWGDRTRSQATRRISIAPTVAFMWKPIAAGHRTDPTNRFKARSSGQRMSHQGRNSC
jgi:hypothetical protein